MESRQQLTDLRGAFRGLSDSHHKILVLRELEGLSYTEIGERMGMTRPVVESTLFRARRRLGEEYEELVTGRRCERVQTVIESPAARRGRALGIREQRLIARHLAHCQPCRRHAHLAGFDDSALQPTGVIGKIAALLPFPVGLWRWRRGAGDKSAVASRGHAFDPVGSMQAITQYAGPSSPLSGFGRAAAAAATLAIAGAGAGGIVAVSSHSSPSKSSSSGGSVASAAARSSSANLGSGGAPLGSGGTAVARGGQAAVVVSSASLLTNVAGAAAAVAAATGVGIPAGAGLRSAPLSGHSGSAGTVAGSSPSAGGGSSPTSGSGGSPTVPLGAPKLNLPASSGVPGLPQPATLPTIAVPQLPTGLVPKPSTVLDPILNAVSGATGSQSGSGSNSASGSNTASGSGSGGSGGSGGAGSGSGSGSGSGDSSSGTTSGTNDTGGGSGTGSGDPTGILDPILSKITGN